MVPEEWPIAPPVSRAASFARRAGRGRLPVVRQDFFLDPAKRLTEQERALMTAMLADLIGGIADELSASLGSSASAANDEDGHQLLLQLSAVGQLEDQALIALLLRRADEERIGSAMRTRTGGHPAFLQALVADSDGSIAAAAMALILARGTRRDRLGQPRIQIEDLPPYLAGDLSHRIADDWAWFSPGVHSQPAIAHSSLFLHGFLARIPRFVWRNLGLPDAPYAAPVPQRS